MTFEVGKKYKTRDGRVARIYATDCNDNFPIQGAVWIKKASEWLTCQWKYDGRFSGDGDSQYDLMEIELINLSDEYQTRDGRQVRIYDIDGGGDYPVHGSILNDSTNTKQLYSKQWRPATWTAVGKYDIDSHENKLDLVRRVRIDMKKKYQIRLGMPVQLYYEEFDEEGTIVGIQGAYYLDTDKEWIPVGWNIYGNYRDDGYRDPKDLVEVENQE